MLCYFSAYLGSRKEKFVCQKVGKLGEAILKLDSNTQVER